jgi:hypothetical protein
MQARDQFIQPENNALKAVAQSVPFLVLVLLAGSIYFFKERMLFIDAPHVFFRIVNDGHLHIEEHRLGSFITQMFPLLGSKLHLPFTFLLILYSASFYLFFLAVALLLVYRYKNYALAILFGLYLTLFVSDTYFWPNNEVHQGIAWLMLAFAANAFIATKNRPLVGAVIFFAASFYLAIWTHPLVMLAAIYLWIFAWLDNTNWPYRKIQSIIFTLILFVLAGFKLGEGMHHGYDGTRLEVVTGGNLHLGSVLSAPMLTYFLKSCLYNYWAFVLLFLSGIVGMAIEKKYLPLLWTILFSLGYLFLLCLAYPDAQGGRFYFESEFMPLTIIGCAPFVYYVLPRLSKVAGITLLILVFSIRIGHIVNASVPFTTRVHIMDTIVQKMKEKNLTKIIIPAPVPAIDSALIMNWGAPVESIFISKLKGETTQRTIIFVPPVEVKAAQSTANDTMLACWEKRGPAQINSRYFRVDTSAPYKIIDYATLMQ